MLKSSAASLAANMSLKIIRPEHLPSDYQADVNPLRVIRSAAATEPNHCVPPERRVVGAEEGATFISTAARAGAICSRGWHRADKRTNTQRNVAGVKKAAADQNR